MAATTKDTIYIDIDDEITSIIDKVRASKHKIVALVLPKRASTLQSIVNMRLLKRTGQETDKRIVLITSEASLLPLAGIVGMYTAKTLQSKPVIPPTPDTSVSSETLVDDDTAEPELDGNKSIGELAGMPEVPEHNSLGAVAVEETIDVDNTDTGDATGAAAIAKKLSKNKIKIPNFESFRLRLFLGILAFIILIVGWVLAFVILPKARVVVKTDTSTITSNINFTAQAELKAVDTDKFLIPAVSKEVKKTDSVKVTATGQKNVGEKATGTMTLTNCINDGVSHTVPAGTGFSSGGFIFLTDTAVTLDPALYSGSSCKSATFGLSKNVAATAAQSGDQFNLSARSYTSPASQVTASGSVTAFGSAMSGGTTKNIIVIGQQDIDNAKTQLTDKSKDAATTEITKVITDAKLLPLLETMMNADPAVTAAPNVGEEAADVTVTMVTTYTMLGVKEGELKKLIELDAKKQLDLAKQPIVDYGLDKAVYHLVSKRSANDQSLSLQTIAVAGTKIDPELLKKEIVGKKKGDVQSTVSAHPGVKDVTVNFSPPWVAKIPKKTNRIVIVFEQTNSNGK